MLSFPFNLSQSKSVAVNQMNHLYFHRRSIIGQLNAQTATAEKVNYVT